MLEGENMARKILKPFVLLILLSVSLFLRAPGDKCLPLL